MSEGIDLPAVARFTLLAEAERVGRLERAIPQIEAALAGEADEIAVEATLACLLFDVLPQANWCGFYRRTGEQLLTVGPYHGSMGCLRISFDRGVCGACARTGEVQLVPDVHLFPGHIACDDASRSELVIPVVAAGRVRGVLDLDSPHVAGFSAAESRLIEGLLGRAFAAVVW
jgi:GAF domain-containing protein